MKKLNVTDSVFRDISFQQGSFFSSTMSNVLFENCTFFSPKSFFNFGSCLLQNVTFRNCIFHHVEFDDSKLINVDFSQTNLVQVASLAKRYYPTVTFRGASFDKNTTFPNRFDPVSFGLEYVS